MKNGLKNGKKTYRTYDKPRDGFYEAGQLIPPVSRGNIDIRVDSVNPHPGKEILDMWDTIDLSDVLSPFQKLFTIEIARLYEQCGTVACATPQPHEVRAMGNALFEWTHQVSKRSPLVRALKTARIISYQLIVDLKNWTGMLAQRSQNRDGSHFQTHYLLRDAEKHASFVLSTVDNIILEIAGPKADKLQWENLRNNIILGSDPFRRFLFECYGLVLRQDEVKVESKYPWFVRYTENIQRDAPSQSHIYLRVANESLHREIQIGEIVKWHKETRPVSDQLLKDILPVVTPGNDRRPDDNSISTGTTGASNNSNLYSFEENADDRYAALLDANAITPDKQLQVLTQYTPVNQPLPGLVASDLDLWGSGNSIRQSQGILGQPNSNANEIAQLLARVAELQALQQVPSSNVMLSRSSPRPTYPPVNLWGPDRPVSMLRSNIANHNSRGLIVPRHANLQDGRRSVSFLTKELKIDMVTEASYATLTKMKEQVDIAI